MKRLIDYHLLQWKESPIRKSLLLRGARQVGKTYAVRQLGKTFESFVEINLETNKRAQALFEADLDPVRIMHEISILTGQVVVPGKTLLFFDEVQAVPAGITALRYFYEEVPELHVIAAGSLLDFAIEQVGVPVGRVQFLYMYPLSFMEFLCAVGRETLARGILELTEQQEISDAIHNLALTQLGHYFAIGGMPQAVACWKEHANMHMCADIPLTLIAAYQYDFVKYGKSHQIKYLDHLFSRIPQQLGKNFKFSALGDYKKRELEPCVDLLVTAGVVHRVMYAAGQGIPLGAQADFDTFKLIFLDIGLTQLILDFKVGDWFINPLQEFINKGMLTESFVGQELMAYGHPRQKAQLYYWKRDARGSEAEVDYLIQHERAIIPVEVKSGGGKTLKSMHMFLDSHPQSPYGIRFSTNNYSVYDKIKSYPLYAIATAVVDDSVAQAALHELTEK